MISKDEIKHLARLLRLELEDREVEKYREDLSAILDYMEELKELDVKNVNPTSHSIDLQNVVRADEAEKEKEPTIKKLVGSAPLHDADNYIKTKPILKPR